MYCSSVGLEDKGGIQSDLSLNKCLGGGGLFLRECLILRDRENLSKSDSRFLMLYVLGLGMNQGLWRELVQSYGLGVWLLNYVSTVNPIGCRTKDVEVGAVEGPLLGWAEPPVVAMSCWETLLVVRWS